MKGLLLKFLSMEAHTDYNTKDKDTLVTYETIDDGDPGDIIWNKMTEDLREIYLDDSNYGIMLECSNTDCPVPDAISWGGYRYQWSQNDGFVVTEVWYVFIQAKPAS